VRTVELNLATDALDGAIIAAITATTTKTITMTTLQKLNRSHPRRCCRHRNLRSATGFDFAKSGSNVPTTASAFDRQIKQLRQQRDDATNKLAALQQENERLHRNSDQLAKLRGEVARLRPLQNDVSTLQKVANASVSGLAEWKPDQLMNAGQTTPQDALQTYLGQPRQPT